MRARRHEPAGRPPRIDGPATAVKAPQVRRARMSVRVGTSGWSYPDWNRVVYPSHVGAAERLTHYAHALFRTVEVNTTYYGMPSRRTLAAWLHETDDVAGFEFTLKATRELTHRALVDGTPRDCEQMARTWTDAAARPFEEAGRMGAILLQLSPAVVRSAEALARLDATVAALAPREVAVEFRNRSWLDDNGDLGADGVALLDRHGAAAVIVDGPSFPAVIQGRAPHAYLRFHGRNKDVWHKTGRNKPENNPADPRLDRYDYLYGEDKLRPWARTVAKLADEKRTVRVYFNNHAHGQAALDGATFERMLRAAGVPLERVAADERAPVQRRLD